MNLNHVTFNNSNEKLFSILSCFPHVSPHDNHDDRMKMPNITVDGCEPGPNHNHNHHPPQSSSSSSSHASSSSSRGLHQSSGGRRANGGSPSSSSSNSPPTTTLLQNILQQTRGANGASIYSALRQTVVATGPNGQTTTTNTSPLPPSPADSGVSDVDSHYSSNDEQQQQQQQQQQLVQYGYFYPSAAHRSTCEFFSSSFSISWCDNQDMEDDNLRWNDQKTNSVHLGYNEIYMKTRQNCRERERDSFRDTQYAIVVHIWHKGAQDYLQWGNYSSDAALFLLLVVCWSLNNSQVLGALRGH